ncbi:MAG: orotidine-5'-phosphate decarboxylase [candidate division KSB1 bacterium]|nr:orotidine-5'-phosphate decarboxylase [candidate division KSB1 bacterium]
MKTAFNERVNSAIKQSNSLLCVGLDTDIARLPESIRREKDALFEFNKRMIDATIEYVAAYKLNLAFYEAQGYQGFKACEKTFRYIPEDKIKIADAKRGDIGNTAEQYVRSVFDNLDADAVTVNPYMGYDAAVPFIKRPEYGVFFLCLTSNKSSKDFQYFSNGKQTLYEKVAKTVGSWNTQNNCGLVVGATHPEELGKIRKIAPDLPFLIPGIGTQGGSPDKSVLQGTDANAGSALFNSSRSIIYASLSNDFEQAAREAAKNSRDQLNTARQNKLRREGMKEAKAIELFEKSGALLNGHFQLTSGLHSPQYFQCAKVLQYPDYSEQFAQAIIKHFKSDHIDCVISPAVGGIIFGYEVARQLNCRNIFSERVNNVMTLRRGLQINNDERVLVIEDVITTGGSVKEVIELVEGAGAGVVGVGSIVDRSGGKKLFDVPYYSVFNMDVVTYEPETCPLCAKGSKPIKPGSRPARQ